MHLNADGNPLRQKVEKQSSRPRGGRNEESAEHPLATTGRAGPHRALLLALLALGAITSIGTLAKMINNIFANAASNIGTATGP